MITRKKLINQYIGFFKTKGHKEIPNSPLIPENDPTTLFISAGMHPLVPYLLGQPHPLGKKLVNIQKCIRTGDIEKVGDEHHHTFFEMLGNWSLGDYFKKEAIEYSVEFLTKVLKIPKEKISVTCFGGDKNAPKDNESAKIWKSLGIKKIKFLPKKDNWWGPAGLTGPCGPDTEMFIRQIEIWNDVFMQYNKLESGKYILLKQKNVDTGMGVERVVAILTGVNDDYLTDSYKPIIEKIEKLSGKKYGKDKGITRTMRIIADHIKASVFILSEGIYPSNTEQGYVLRRLIRRAIRYGKELEIENFTTELVSPILKIYQEDYPELKKNEEFIREELKKEEEKFKKCIEDGLNKFEKLTEEKKSLSGANMFLLHQSYGFPFEMTQELAKEKEIKIINIEDFKKESEKHKTISGTAIIKGRFKSGLADQSQATTKLHTATHLLLAALRIVLKKPDIIQRGSNITAERLRFDFSFPRQLTKQELKEIENLVNAQIQNSCEVKRKEMPLEEARKKGIITTFNEKYGEIISVYEIDDFSKEICAGPHVENLCKLGKFKIIKEESSSAGVRRIRAILE